MSFQKGSVTKKGGGVEKTKISAKLHELAENRAEMMEEVGSSQNRRRRP